MSEEGIEPELQGFDAAFAASGEWVPIEVWAPQETAELSRLGGGLAESPELVVGELSPGALSAWGRNEGWPAFQAWMRDFAKHLGGSVEFQSFRNVHAGTERHEMRFNGKVVDL